MEDLWRLVCSALTAAIWNSLLETIKKNLSICFKNKHQRFKLRPETAQIIILCCKWLTDLNFWLKQPKLNSNV